MPLQDKPFAEHKIVLQLSDSDPKKQGLVISVANNLMKFYDPDKVAIEVVTFGPGIDLLKPDNPNRKAIESIVAQGVASTSASTPSTRSSAKPASARSFCPSQPRCKSASRKSCISPKTATRW